jgi:hypothetical protein
VATPPAHSQAPSSKAQLTKNLKALSPPAGNWGHTFLMALRTGSVGTGLIGLRRAGQASITSGATASDAGRRTHPDCGNPLATMHQVVRGNSAQIEQDSSLPSVRSYQLHFAPFIAHVNHSCRESCSTPAPSTNPNDASGLTKTNALSNEQPSHGASLESMVALQSYCSASAVKPDQPASSSYWQDSTLATICV